MKVVAYVSEDANAPAGETHIARIRTLVPGKKNKLVEGWHPVVFTGASEASVRLQAAEWWLRQIEAERNRQAGIAKAVAKRAEARAAGQALSGNTQDGAS